MQLKNKVILLAGSGGLIGREILKDARENGATVIGVDYAENRWGENPDVIADLTSQQSIDQLLNDIVEKYGRIDGLVNSAYPRTQDWGNKFEDITLESWQKNVDMQMNMVFYICQQTAKIMQKQQHGGSIVNISSIYGVVGNDFTLYEGYGGTSPMAYNAIKGGLINLTRSMASYLGKDNIRVNCMSPGGVIDGQNPKFIEEYNRKSPMKRMAKPEEMSGAVIFLLSDKASFVTGHNLMVDGGWTAI